MTSRVPLRAFLPAALALAFVSCTSLGDKTRVYTSFSDVAFLDDSSAALIVVDVTEKEASLGSPYVDHSDLSVYRIPFAAGAKIEPMGKAVEYKSLHAPEFLPWIIGKDLLLADPSSGFGAFVSGGRINSLNTDSCCVNWGPGPKNDEYILKTLNGSFFLWDKDSGSGFRRLNADTVFDRSPPFWYDITVRNGFFLGVFRDSSRYFLASRSLGGTPEQTTFYGIPGLDSTDSRKKIFFIPGYDVLLKGTSAPLRGDYCDLGRILSGSRDTTWLSFSRARSPGLKISYVRTADSLFFQPLVSNQVLSRYDLTRFLKKNL